MRGSSLASLEAVRAKTEPVLAAAGMSAAMLGEQLFSVVDVLDSTGALRRALTDPARSGEDKARLVSNLLGARLDERAVTVVSQAVASRWSQSADVADALERLAVDAVLADAENQGALARVADELFATSRVLMQQPKVREALAERRSTRDAREHLVAAMFGSSVHADTMILVERAAGSRRGGHVVPVLQRYTEMAAERRNRTVARVSTSSALSEAQVKRLAALLSETYGRQVSVDVAVEPRVVGGMRIQVGADVLDATMLTRVADVRRSIAS